MLGEGLKLFFRAGVFLVIAALLLLFLVPRGSAEFVVTILTLLIGALLVALSLLVQWWRR